MPSLFAFSRKNVFLLGVIGFLLPMLAQAQSLSDTWVKGMELSISTSGGMREQQSEIIISDGGCFVLNGGLDDTGKKEFTLTQQQLDNLATVLKRNHFDKITSARRKRIVADMSTTNTALSWNGYKFEYSIGASMEVIAKYKEDASRIDAYVTKLVEAALKSSH